MILQLAAHPHQPDYSPRQNDVLDSALRLLVDGGEKALTTASVARAANCSKESLYKWFGDRDGLLSAMIGFQASKVRTFEDEAEALTAATLHDHLVLFAHASKIQVGVKHLGDSVEVSVHDNGVGFDPSMKPASAHGLLGMRYRVEASGGDVQITSASGQGTHIVAHLPALADDAPVDEAQPAIA